jgi:hypothetical protein
MPVEMRIATHRTPTATPRSLCQRWLAGLWNKRAPAARSAATSSRLLILPLNDHLRFFVYDDLQLPSTHDLVSELG